MPALAPAQPRSIALAIIKLEEITHQPDAFPGVTQNAMRAFREICEDAITSCPKGVSPNQIAESLRIPKPAVFIALHSLPGLLAIYAPGLVRLSRSAGSRGNDHRYFITPA